MLITTIVAMATTPTSAATSFLMSASLTEEVKCLRRAVLEG